MDTETALELVAIVRRLAHERGLQMTVAVHDDAGHPVAVVRGKGKWHRPYTAMGKARLASAFQKPTKDLVEQWADRPLFPQSLIEVLPGGVTVNAGGYPVIVDGECLGAIGVGGSNPDNDHAVARDAVAEFVASRAAR